MNVCHFRFKAIRMESFLHMVVLLLLGIHNGLAYMVSHQEKLLTVFPDPSYVYPGKDPGLITQLLYV